MDSDQLADEREAIIRWYAVTQHPNWDETVQALLMQRLRDSNQTAVDWRKPDTERIAAAAKMEAIAELVTLKDRYAIAHEAMVADEAEQAEPENVGPKLEDQWYEKR